MYNQAENHEQEVQSPVFEDPTEDQVAFGYPSSIKYKI